MPPPGPYRFEAYRVDASCVYTNTAPSGSYRAFGATHLQWIGELQIDELARRCGLDPLAVRQANLCARGEEVRAGGRPLDADIIGDVEKAARAVGWGEPKGPNIGRGVSVGLLAAGAHPVSTAVVRMEADGEVTVLVGHDRARPGRAHRVRADRGRGALDHARAGDRARHRHALHALRPLDGRQPLDDDRGPGRAARRGGRAPRSCVEIAGSDDLDAETFPELFVQHFGLAGGELIGRGEVAPEGTGSYAEGPVFWEICIGAAEVEVDPETGQVHVRKTATIADVGIAINPQLVERQDEGGTMQGLGNALFEEMVYQDGALLNPSMLEYRVPSINDMPDSMTCIIVENADGPGPYGAKGCGEGSLAGDDRRRSRPRSPMRACPSPSFR